MTKHEITEAIINVFENGAPIPFVNGLDYHIYAPGAIPPHLAYPAHLTSINDTALGRNEHPFVHVTGGYEEIPRVHAATVFPAGCRVFYFNDELFIKMNHLYPLRSFGHNNQIQTLPHNVIDRHGFPVIQISERPDLFEVNGNTPFPPNYHGVHILAASQAGHNFVCQTTHPTHGIFDKMCHELWRLSESGINRCFFIALYTHKQNLVAPDICSPLYWDANLAADFGYQTELNTYRSDIVQIDPDYLHLLFKGVRPTGMNTFFHVFIVEKPANLDFVQVPTPNGIRIRPEGYQNIDNQ